MPTRDWTTICQLEDGPTRLAISLANDPEILAGFAQGFPHLFKEGDDEGPLRVPLSALQEAAYEFAREHYSDSPECQEHDRHFSLASVLDKHAHLRIPASHWWNEDKMPPQSVLDQLEDQVGRACMPVEYNGVQYLVLDIAFASVIPAGQKLAKIDSVGQMILVLPEFVDLDA